MSKEIYCPSCHAPNTPGSKFCNNCGTRLPPGTSLICPNCETANSRDRLYCDTCGTRLVQDAQTIPQEPNAETEDQSSDKNSFFSLPIRPAGETGELDPNKKVPDWLKGQPETGEKSGGKSLDDKPPREHMPKIEEIGSAKRMTDDLPDWLINEHDSKPIIGSPRIITTEHYVNLIEESDENETGADLAEAAEQAELPDWLTDLANPTSGDQVTTSRDQSTADDTLAEWLADISQSGLDDGDQTAAADTIENGPTEDNHPSEPDDFPATQQRDISHETADWLAELRTPNTDSLASPEKGEDEEEPALENEMFDWFEEKMSDTGLLAEPTGGSTEPASENLDTGDWLTDFMESDSQPPDTSGLASPMTSDTEEPADEEIINWANMADFGQTDDRTLANLTDAVAQHDIGSVDETLEDWLAEIPASDEEPAAETIPDTDSETDLPDWMREFTASETKEFNEQIESIMEDSDETVDSQQLEALSTDDNEEIVQTTGLTGEFEQFLAGEDETWVDDLAAVEEDGSEKSKPETPNTKTSEPEIPEKKQSGPLPDWLTDLGRDETLVSPSADDDALLSDLFAFDGDAAADDMDWLTEDEPSVEPEDKREETDAEPAAFLKGDTDWLSELVEMGDDAFVEQEPAETIEAEDIRSEESGEVSVEEDVFAADWPQEETGDTTPDLDEGDVDEPKIEDSEWFKADTMLSNALEDELPDWLNEMGEPVDVESPGEEGEPLPSSDSLPDWIAELKPGTVYSGSSLSDSLSLSDAVESLPDLPDDLAKADLPDWLQEAALSSKPGELMALNEDASAMPDWLRPDSSDGLDSGLLGLGSQPPADIASDDWTAVLQELPSAAPPQDRIIQAEIPDWIQALKPRELTGEEPEPEPEKPVIETGPLSGIRGVIEIEPVIARPRSNGTLQSFTVTNEQQAQTLLLKQLALVEQTVPSTTTANNHAASGWARILLAGLLLAAMLWGLLQPDLLPRAQITPPPHVDRAYTAVQKAAGQPVLLAIEFTPALSGELNAQAEMLMAQLAANGSPVVTVSQYAAGTAIAHTLAGEQPTLGLVPGESVGLRQLGDCLTAAATCDAVTGVALPSATQQAISDIGLIIVLTGERDSLVNWLEQVGRSSKAPLVAGITQSLGPVAAPYFASDQLEGMIVGMPDTAVYQQTFLSKTTTAINKQLNAQALAQILVAVLLLVGGLWYGITGSVKE